MVIIIYTTYKDECLRDKKVYIFSSIWESCSLIYDRKTFNSACAVDYKITSLIFFYEMPKGIS